MQGWVDLVSSNTDIRLHCRRASIVQLYQPGSANLHAHDGWYFAPLQVLLKKLEATSTAEEIRFQRYQKHPIPILTILYSTNSQPLRGLSNVQICLHSCCVTVLGVFFLLLSCLYIVYSRNVSTVFCHFIVLWTLPSVLWRCWLGGRKGIRPVKNRVQYDTRCYFNVRSKAEISQLNLPHGNRQLKKCKNRRKLKSKKTDMLRSKVNSLENPYSETWRRKRKGCGREDLQERKDVSLERKSEWVIEYQ